MAAATTIVDKDDVVEVAARVETLAQIFDAPEFDPFGEQVRTTAVVDDITAHLRTRHLRHRPQVALTLLLPPDQHHDGVAAEATAAIQRYAARKVAELAQEIEITRFEGRARLPWGIVVAVMTLLLVIFLNVILPENFELFLVALSPVVSVIIWVAIWNPAEALLYENWMLRRQKATYIVLGKTQVYVKAQ